jgi:sigma-54 dependent transcriptional regulator, flagellar regulatory protein
MGIRWAQTPQNSFAELIGESEAIKDIRQLIDQVAESNSTVLVTGPSGSGKEVVAQRLHQRSARAVQPFVAVNCSAIPRDLLESEILGHEAGAFTGAVRARRGRFETADKGTLFLDEIGDMPADMQVKLLRVLETRVVERVGSMIGVPVDVRVVAATNVDLDAAIDDGRFREDLFYRLNVVEVRLPTLAERRGDIALLLEHFAALAGARRVHFSDSAIALLTDLPWRGNVRELRNLVDRATALHAGKIVDRVTVERLASAGRRPVEAWLATSATATIPPPRLRPPRLQPAFDGDGPVDLKAMLDDVEQSLIEHALERSAGGVAESARMLGLRRTTLIEKMRRLNIQRLPSC